MSAPVFQAPRYSTNLAYSGSNVEFVGIAEPGTTKAQALWAIFKLTYSGSNVTEVRWANATRKFDKVWDDRATYTYSVT